MNVHSFVLRIILRAAALVRRSAVLHVLASVFSQSAKRQTVHGFGLLLAIGSALIFDGQVRANAQPVLVNSIIDSSKTDNPPRFCWKFQVSDDGRNWLDTRIDDPDWQEPLPLDLFTGGHLDFGSDFTETNIVASGPHGEPIRLHRVPCTEPHPSNVAPNPDDGGDADVIPIAGDSANNNDSDTDDDVFNIWFPTPGGYLNICDFVPCWDEYGFYNSYGYYDEIGYYDYDDDGYRYHLLFHDPGSNLVERLHIDLGGMRGGFASPFARWPG